MISYIRVLALSAQLSYAIVFPMWRKSMNEIINSELDNSIEQNIQYYYVKRFKLITSETLGFLQGAWLESKQYTREELLEEFALTEDFLTSLETSIFEAATHDDQWVKIMPLKNMRVVK